MKLCLIVNPNAGKKRGLEIAGTVARRLAEAGIETEAMVSSAPGQTREIAAGIDPAEWDGIIAVGGDGTLFEVVNGLLEKRDSISLPIGEVPVGTGNSFLRDLGIESVEDALAAIVGGTMRRVDLGRFTCPSGSYHFINLLGAGFVSNVAYRAKKYKALGSLSYILGVIEEVIGLESTSIKLEIDGERIERDAIFVEICNSRFTGGTMMMAPGAKIDDGLLDVVLVNRINRRTVLKLLPTIFSGKHVEAPAVELFRGKHIRLTSARPLALTPDGETLGTTPIEVSVLPGALSMFGS